MGDVGCFASGCFRSRAPQPRQFQASQGSLPKPTGLEGGGSYGVMDSGLAGERAPPYTGSAAPDGSSNLSRIGPETVMATELLFLARLV